MTTTIRNITNADVDAVLELNEANVPELGSSSAEQMRWFVEHVPYFKVAEVDGSIGALLVGMRPGLDYTSPNYRWFIERYDDFGYIDRVAVAEHARRLGLASRLYADFESTLPASVKVMTCEVNLRPPNDASMRYHLRHGFSQVGSQETEGGKKEVAMLAKTLDRRT
jgi:predicted GNAT superfamily acetyltransferase